MYKFEENNDKDFGHFGLNQNCKVKSFVYNPNGGKDNTPAECMDLTVSVEGTEYKSRFFPVSKVYSKGSELTDKNSEEYKKVFEREVKMLSATLCSIAECFIPKETLQKTLSAGFADFKAFATALENLVKAANYTNIPVDVFLQYQRKVVPGKTRAYLELPNSVRYGRFVVSAQKGNFVEKKTETSIKYLNENNEEHPINRGKYFVESAHTNRIVLDDNSTNFTDMGGNNSGDIGW